VGVVEAVAVVAGLVTTVLTLRHRHRPGPAQPVAAMLVVSAAWAALGLTVGAVDDVATKTAVFRLIFPVGGLLAAAVLWHALVLARGRPWTRGSLLLALLVEPVLAAVVAVLDATRPVLLGSTVLDGDAFLLTFRPLAWAHIAYCLLAVVVALVLMDRARRAAIPAHRWRYAVAMLALVLPAVGAVVSVSGASTFGAVDLTGAMSVVTAGIWLWTGGRGDATASLPISLQQVISAVADGVVVVDERGRVVQANPAAHELLAPDRAAHGTPEVRLLGRLWEDLLPRESDAAARAGRLVTTTTGRVLDIRVTEVGTGGLTPASVVVVRDATDRERLRAELADQALRDGLTGLHNRRHLDMVLGPAVAAARLGGRPLTAAMVDVDRFKAVNDGYGHASGDRVIQAVADVLATSVRAGETLVRYGGEEFLVLVPEGDAGAVLERMELVRRRCAALAVDTRAGQVRVTVSIGVAGLPDGAGGDGLLRLADEALYAAKAAGRDMVISAPACPPAPLGTPLSPR